MSLNNIGSPPEMVVDDSSDHSQGVRALVVMPLSEQRGGGELMLLHLIEHGRDMGVEWSVVFFDEGPMKSFVENFGISTYIVSTGRLRQPHRMVAAIWTLRRLIREHQISAVLSWMGKGQIYGGAAAFLAGVSAVWYQLGLPDPPGWQDRIATSLPARTVLTCSSTSTVAQSKLSPFRQTLTVHPGVDLARFDPDRLPSAMECRRQLGLPESATIIGIVGRLQSWKGIHHLIDAMPAVLAAIPDAYCLIVGGTHAFEPEYPELLASRIAKLNLRERIITTGLQSNIPEWMQAMDIVVHASSAEPFGIVVIEAMSLGKPIIATATAGPSEIITNNVDGFLWLAGDTNALSSCIVRVLKGGVFDEAMAKRARKRAADFDVKTYARHVATVVRAAAAEPN